MKRTNWKIDIIAIDAIVGTSIWEKETKSPKFDQVKWVTMKNFQIFAQERSLRSSRGKTAFWKTVPSGSQIMNYLTTKRTLWINLSELTIVFSVCNFLISKSLLWSWKRCTNMSSSKSIPQGNDIWLNALWAKSNKPLGEIFHKINQNLPILCFQFQTSFRDSKPLSHEYCFRNDKLLRKNSMDKSKGRNRHFFRERLMFTSLWQFWRYQSQKRKSAKFTQPMLSISMFHRGLEASGWTKRYRINCFRNKTRQKLFFAR